MKAPREHSRSVWMTIEVAPDCRPLASDGETDVVVIGSGIAGLSIAYELTSRGHAAVVVDRGEIAGGMTSRTTAHLTPICDGIVPAMVLISRPTGPFSMPRRSTPMGETNASDERGEST